MYSVPMYKHVKVRHYFRSQFNWFHITTPTVRTETKEGPETLVFNLSLTRLTAQEQVSEADRFVFISLKYVTF